MIQIFQIIDSKLRRRKKKHAIQSYWPYAGIISVTINYLGFKSMAFSTEFNAFDSFRFESHVIRCTKKVKKKKVKLKHWTRTNYSGSSLCTRRSVASLLVHAHSMEPMQKESNNCCIFIFIQPKIKCRVFFLWSAAVAVAAMAHFLHNTSVHSSFPAAAAADCCVWYLRRKKAGCAPALRRLCTHYFHFHFKVFGTLKQNKKTND